MVLTVCLSQLLRLCPFVDLRGELLLEVGAQEAVEEEPSRAVQLERGSVMVAHTSRIETDAPAASQWCLRDSRIVATPPPSCSLGWCSSFGASGAALPNPGAGEALQHPSRIPRP